MGQPGFLAGWEPPPSLQAPTSGLRPPVETDSKHPARPPRPVPALFSPRIPDLPSNTSVSRRLQACPRLHPPHNCHRNALQQAKTALPHRALAPGASPAGETEAGRAQQPLEPWQAAGGCLLPPRSLPRPLRPVWAGSGVGAALEQGFPALCSPPAPRAHGRHVISCSFFAPLIISAPVRHTARPCRPSPTSTRPQGGDSSAGRFGSPQPWQRQTATRGPSCFAHRFRFESDLYAQSWGISGPDCLHRVRQPTARALGAPAPAFRIFYYIFFLRYGPVFAWEFQTMERDRALTEGKKYISSLNKYCFL